MAAVVCALAVSAALVDGPRDIEAVAAAGNGNGPVKGNPAPGKAFTISGDVVGLVPDADTLLAVTINNPNQQAIAVTDVTVKVTSPKASCPASVVQIDPWGSSFTVPGRSSATRSIDARLTSSASDACKGVQFDLRYSGKAVQQ